MAKGWKDSKEFCQNKKCPNDHAIDIAIFKGQGYCSIDCRKALGIKDSGIGTMVLLTPEEHSIIKAERMFP